MPNRSEMSQGLTIRRKVALTLALPIFVMGSLAGAGLVSASADLSAANGALRGANDLNLVHAASQAIGAERLAYQVAALPDRADAESDQDAIQAAAEITDSAINSLPVSSGNGQLGVSNSGLADVRASLNAARSTPVSRSTNFGRASVALLNDGNVGAVLSGSAADQQNRTDQQNLHRWMDATEAAWVMFAERPTDELRPTAEVLEAFAASAALQDVLAGSSGPARTTIGEVLDSTRVLEDLRLTAVQDLLNPSESVVNDQAAILTLRDARSRWLEASTEIQTQAAATLQAGVLEAEAQRNQYGLFGLMGMLSFTAAGVMLYHAVTGPIAATAAAARSTIGERLPVILESLRDPEGAPVRPTHVEGGADDELGQLVHAVNDVQDGFYELAHENALGRERVAQRTVALSRKNARLLHDLVRHVAAWRVNSPDPDTNARLFQVDHLATRMQRNVEAAILLSGAHSERQWTHAVSATNTARLALGEVGAFDRVDISPNADVLLRGSAAPDVAHILAELIENGLKAADPHLPPAAQRVRVECTWVSAGLAFTVHDNGQGMTDSERANFNQRLHTPLAAHEGPTRFLGLYVVAKLAKRHGIDVRMLEGPNGGTVVRVVLPVDLIDPASVPTDRKTIDAGRGVTVGVQAAKVNERPVQTQEQEQAAHLFFGPESAAQAAQKTLVSVPEAQPEVPSGEIDASQESSPLAEQHDLNAELRKLVSDDVPPPTRPAHRGSTGANSTHTTS